MKYLLIVSFFVFIASISYCGKAFIKRPLPAEEKQLYIQAHPNLPELDKRCINYSTFKIGMRSETVRFLIGEPVKVLDVENENIKLKKWVYRGSLFRKKVGIKAFILNSDGIVIEINKFRSKEQ